MERYTFAEIRNFTCGNVFWARNDKFVVSCDPIYITESNFYGDFSEKLEWSAISETTKGEVKFQITNTKDKNNPSNPIIFKTATGEPVIAGAGKRIE